MKKIMKKYLLHIIAVTSLLVSFSGSLFAQVYDVDGNSYNTVSVGNQVWMAGNLKTTKYNDGTAIPIVTDNTAWNALPTGAYCWYLNDATTYKATYGSLYNWYAVDNNAATKMASNGGKNVCPTGWHIPTDAEWTTLTDYLTNNGYGYAGSGSDIAKSMAATSGWITDPTAGDVGNDQASNNSSGFTALPGGYRYLSGPYNYIGAYGFWWSSTESSTTYAWYRDMTSNDPSVGRHNTEVQDGLAVSCINDPPTATINGTTAVCMGAAPPNITFTGTTGTAPFTFTYTINGGTNKTITTTSGNSVTVSVPTGTAGTYTYNLVSVQDVYKTVAQTGSAVVTINPLPTANAGTAFSSICQGGTSAALGGSVGGSATGGIWSTPAGGTFNPNASDRKSTCLN